MKLSVIVTDYKCERYLLACLDSIAALTGDVVDAMCGVAKAAHRSRHADWHFRRTLKCALGMVYRTAFPRRGA